MSQSGAGHPAARASGLGSNSSVGAVSAAVVTFATAGFGVTMFLPAPWWSYAMAMLLAPAFVVLAASLGAEAVPERRSVALAGVTFAGMYGSLAIVVYFIQLTTVLQNSASLDILQALSDTMGSLMFNLDLLSYGLMALSTLFIGLSMKPSTTADRVLQVLLVVHGVFAPVCVLMPALNIFGTMEDSEGRTIGLLVLVGWCLYFTPIGLLAFIHFLRFAHDIPERSEPDRRATTGSST